MEKKIILIIVIILFTSILLLFSQAAPNDSVKLQNRFKLGGFFVVIGLPLVIFKEKIGKFLYERRTISMKQKTSPEKLAGQVKFVGTFMLSTGILVVIIGAAL